MVGASSTISLKEINEVIQIYNKYTLYYNVNNNNKEDEKEDEKEDNQSNIDDTKILSLAQDIIADASFAFQSCISLLSTVFLNKMLIYILKESLNQKKLLYVIAGISIAANILSSCLFIVYSRPKKRIEERNNEEENVEIYKEEHNSNIEELFLLSNNQININKKLIDKSIQTNGNEEHALFVDIYFFKKQQKMIIYICVFYKYSGKWSWIKSNFLGIINIFPVCLELYCQLQIVAFKPLLSEKMLKSFSDWKCIGFII